MHFTVMPNRFFGGFVPKTLFVYVWSTCTGGPKIVQMARYCNFLVVVRLLVLFSDESSMAINTLWWTLILRFISCHTPDVC